MELIEVRFTHVIWSPEYVDRLSVKMSYKDKVLGQITALMLVDICIKFHEI